MSARVHRGDRSKPPEPKVPESRRREGSETETAWTDVDAIVLTDADLARAYEMFQPEQPSGPAFSGTSPTNSGASDSNPLDFFACEPSSADETRLRTTKQTIADVQIAVARPVAGTAEDASWSGLASIAYATSDVALIRSESVVPQLARTPIELEPRRPFTWQRRALLALIVALGVGIGVAGVTIVRHSARLTTSEDVSAPPSQPQSPDLAARALPSTTIVPSSVPMALRAAVDARRPEVAAARNPSVLPPLANTERPSRPTAPSTPASALTDLTPSQAVLQPTPPAATIGVAPAAVSEPSPPVARVPVPSVAMPVREPEPSPPPPVAPPVLVAPPATAISPASAAEPRTAPPSSVATPARVTDTGAIQTVLSRYRNAFSVLDAGAAKAVWPTVDAKALGRAFDQLQEQTLEFDACAITVTGARAVASCGGNAEYVPKVGNKTPRTEAREWRFSLRRVNEEWLIEAVASR